MLNTWFIQSVEQFIEKVWKFAEQFSIIIETVWKNGKKFGFYFFKVTASSDEPMSENIENLKSVLKIRILANTTQTTL